MTMLFKTLIEIKGSKYQTYLTVSSDSDKGSRTSTASLSWDIGGRHKANTLSYYATDDFIGMRAQACKECNWKLLILVLCTCSGSYVGLGYLTDDEACIGD